MEEAKIPAITVEAVSKDFLLPHEKIDSLKGVFVNPFRGKAKAEVQHALKNVSFEVRQGEFFGIVGRNGSGKSTLLKIIAGIYKPTKGSVAVNGRLVPFIELGVGFNPELTGRENVFLNGALMGFSTEEITNKYAAIVEFAELERFMDQKLKNYSSGMQVRLAFSVATVLAESDILLIDEVLAVGDADFQRKCFEYFRKLKKSKKTVVFVSHDMNAVREYCDRAILIDKSEVVFAGTAEKTAKEYTRLFFPDVHAAEQANENRQDQKTTKMNKWGQGGANIRKLRLDKKVVKSEDETVGFAIDVVTERHFTDGIIPGFVIKDEQGRAICGTNSQILQQYDRQPVVKGETVTFNWKVPNIFSDGNYVIEPAIIDGGNMELCQWWDEAAKFKVVNDTNSPYVITPKIELTVGAN